MIAYTKKSLTAFALILWSACSFAQSAPTICSELSPLVIGKQLEQLSNPARVPSNTESAIIDQWKITLFDSMEYAKGVSIVDADNDGRPEVFAWNIQGSGRFVYAELFELNAQKQGQTKAPASKISLDLGVLEAPRFVRWKGINYLISSDTGDLDGLRVSQINKTPSGTFEQRTLCQMRTTVKPDTSCGHPACKALRAMIADKSKNAPFVHVEWPHKYFSPAGLEVYFSADWSTGDFDNTGQPTSIWRIGRDGYINQHIYWSLLGQGESAPSVMPSLRPSSEDRAVRKVLPGNEHDRLRRSLNEQSAALSAQLHRPISLPNAGEFFLFQAHGDRTYWAWDLGIPAYGEEIYLMYTNPKKSDFVGQIRIKRDQGLVACTSQCVASSER